MKSPLCCSDNDDPATECANVGWIELAGGGIVSRGVLLDIPRVRGRTVVGSHRSGFPEDLDAAEAAQGLRAESGDILFVRAGFHADAQSLGRGRRPKASAPFRAV